MKMMTTTMIAATTTITTTTPTMMPTGELDSVFPANNNYTINPIYWKNRSLETSPVGHLSLPGCG